MRTETLSRTPDQLIRRMILAPGEPMDWHSDRCRRFTVVVRGDALAIEYADTGETVAVEVHPGLADWDEPETRVHRAINRGTTPYEEVVTFYLNAPDEDPQPPP